MNFRAAMFCIRLVDVMDQSGLRIDADLDDEWTGGGQTQLELIGQEENVGGSDRSTTRFYADSC